MVVMNHTLQVLGLVDFLMVATSILLELLKMVVVIAIKGKDFHRLVAYRLAALLEVE